MSGVRAEPSREMIAAYLRRRRRTRMGFGIGVGLLAASAVLAQLGFIGRAGDDWSRFDHRTFRATGVLSGDTLTIRDSHGNDERIRLIGTEAPDANAPGGAAHGAAESKAYLLGRVAARDVILRLEPTQTRDASGALLAHVYFPDNDNLNRDLIRDGQAYADRRMVHSMQSQFEQDEADARKKSRGFWKGLTEDQMPAWRRQWLAELRAKRERKPTSQPYHDRR